MAGEPVVARKFTARGRVVQIDSERVGEVELQTAKRAVGSGRLDDPLAAFGRLDDLVALLDQRRPPLGEQFPPGDRHGHVPRRIDDDRMDVRHQHRRRIVWAARDGAHRTDRLVAFEHGQYGRRDIHLDPVDRQVARHPAPPLHIRHDRRDPVIHADVERRQRAGVEQAGGVEAIAALRALQHVAQLLAWRHGAILDRDTRAHHVGRGLRGQRRPAALIANRLVADQTLAQAFIARIRRRQAARPLRKPILGHRARERGARIERRGAQRPDFEEIGGIDAPGGQRLGAIQHSAHQRLARQRPARLLPRHQSLRCALLQPVIGPCLLRRRQGRDRCGQGRGRNRLHHAGRWRCRRGLRWRGKGWCYDGRCSNAR